eukprot:TRINITY_DN14656_c0_g1_i1.p1 TRINITY_DN14656_c0_g1~~TRINITY_DN14656_c0_g1_i1.p1  ORF type:complete len:650 (+),score=52.38 TRINITY_DN14656_c0_g1_i1:69-2018(+)
MSFLKFLKTGKKKKDKHAVAPVRQVTRAERFKAIWNEIKRTLEGLRQGNDDGNPAKVRKLIECKIQELVEVVVQEMDEEGIGEAPPCFELMLKEDVIGGVCIYASENAVGRMNGIMLRGLGWLLLMEGRCLDKALIGHHKQVTRPIIELLNSLQTALGATPPNLTLHYSYLFVLYALSSQLAAYHTCFDFFTTTNPFTLALSYIGSDLSLKPSDILDDSPTPSADIYLSDLAIDIVGNMLQCFHPSSVSVIDSKADILPTLIVGDLHVLIESVLNQQSETLKEHTVARISQRVKVINKITAGPYPELQTALKSGFETQISPRLLEVLCTYAGAQLTDYFIREIDSSDYLILPVLLGSDKICEKLTGGILSKEIGLSAATVSMATSMLARSPDKAYGKLISSAFPVDMRQYKKVDLHFMFHPLIMSEGIGYTESHIDATAAVADVRTTKNKRVYGETVRRGSELENGILTAISTKLLTAPSQPFSLNAAVTGFLTQVILCGGEEALSYVLWEDGPVVTAMTGIKDEVEQYAKTNGLVKTRDMANAARRKLGIYNQPLPIDLRLRKKDSREKDALGGFNSFDTYVTLEEWRSSLVTLLAAMREIQSIDTELRIVDDIEEPGSPGSASTGSPRQPPCLFVTPSLSPERSWKS